jgi:hypothetical protein
VFGNLGGCTDMSSCDCEASEPLGQTFQSFALDQVRVVRLGEDARLVPSHDAFQKAAVHLEQKIYA